MRKLFIFDNSNIIIHGIFLFHIFIETAHTIAGNGSLAEYYISICMLMFSGFFPCCGLEDSNSQNHLCFKASGIYTSMVQT